MNFKKKIISFVLESKINLFCIIKKSPKIIFLSRSSSFGDQIIFADFLSRLIQLSNERKDFLNKYLIVLPKEFKKFYEELNLKYKNTKYIKMGFFTHWKFMQKPLIIKILFFKFFSFKSKIFQCDELIFFSRMLFWEQLIFSLNSNNKKLIKLKDPSFSIEDYSQIYNLNNNLLIKNFFNEKIFEKTKIIDTNNSLHYSENIWSIFNEIEPLSKNILFKKPYEFIKYNSNNKKNKLTKYPTILYCVNRKHNKFLKFDILCSLLTNLFYKINFEVIFIGKMKKAEFREIRKIIKNYNFPYKLLINKYKYEELIFLVNNIDFIITEDTWLLHISAMLNKKFLLILNDSSYVFKNSRKFWIEYPFNNFQKCLILNKYFFYFSNIDPNKKELSKFNESATKIIIKELTNY